MHPQKRRVFGYALANPESGTVSLVCFKTPRKSSTNVSDSDVVTYYLFQLHACIYKLAQSVISRLVLYIM